MVRAISFLLVCLFTLLGTVFFITQNIRFNFWCGIAFLLCYIPYFLTTFMSPKEMLQVPDVDSVSLRLVVSWYALAFIATTVSITGYLNSLIYLGQIVGEGKEMKLLMFFLFPTWIISWMCILFHLIISLNIQLTHRAKRKYREKLRRKMLEDRDRRKD